MLFFGLVAPAMRVLLVCSKCICVLLANKSYHIITKNVKAKALTILFLLEDLLSLLSSLSYLHVLFSFSSDVIHSQF